ncbi:unnamed protein product, partial [Didymodactylos carnosus]|jgi:ligand-binding sensor domain-containing protein
MCR